MKVSKTAYLRTAGLALITATALVAGACSSDSGSENAEGSSGTASESGAFPVSIPSALGTAEIPEEPQRVVTLGWGAEDAALALGVVPIAVQDMSSDSGSDDGLLPWSRETLEELDPDAEPTLLKASSKEIPFEQIAELAPDLVLATHSGLTQEQYDKLAEIAPTVAYPERRWATSWEDQITIAGEALGRSDQAEELISSTNESIAKVKSEHPEFEGKNVAFGSATEAGSFNFYFDTDPRMKLLASLGFTIDPLAQQLREGGDPTKFAGPVSMELLPTYQPDVLLAWYLAPDMQRDVENHPLFKELKAVKTNSYIGLTDPPLVFASSSPNVLNIPWMLAELTPKLSEAANNVPQD
ncbi:iron-siderophore ABC transporter substrate-binding protein [Rhodococcus sp. NPDC058521]|uniref:iron-siderophore ABC transporter substrate-binding protein n=1 Tax=Rhodococcus sp. NPDC058521 TaxID=3346536 RepID=UPI00364B2FEB